MSRGSIFKSVRGSKVKKSAFDLSFDRSCSMQMGKLVPVLCQEVLPGDRFRVRAFQLTRLAPMLAPIMHRVDVYIRFFFVPNRLLWSHWEDFITGGKDGTLAPVKPHFLSDDLTPEYFGLKSLADYLDIPDSVVNMEDQKIDALPFIGYHLIWNEMFRDQNLQDPVDLPIDQEGKLNYLVWRSLGNLHNVCWEKDYFTSALPFAQRGPQATFDLGASAPVSGSFLVNSEDGLGIERGEEVVVGGVLGHNYSLETGHGSSLVAETDQFGNGLHADLTGIQGITIKALRELERLQYWLEANGRGGARYVEQILMHWDELVPDARLQRPEYLGGGKMPLNVSQINQTAQPADGQQVSPDNSLGSYAGNGTSVGDKAGFTRHFTEYGFIYGLMYILPRTKYMDGLPKQFFRFDKFDYAFPEFAHLGEQEVLMKEIFCESAHPDAVFGYQSRYAEYKYNFDRVNGDFRSDLDFWHMARKFGNEPLLNASFVEAKPTQRIFAVTDEDIDKIWADLWFDIRCIRKLPKYGTPMLGH